jgi:hypothetical protein
MADLILQVPTGEVSLTGGTAKTVLTLKAPTNQRLKLKGLEVFGKGTSNTDTPVRCEIGLITTDGQTPPTITPLPNDGDLGETPQGTYKGPYSSEPSTYGSILRTWEVHPQTGLVVYFPMHDEIKLKGGQELGVRLTSTQSETFSVNAIVEE